MSTITLEKSVTNSVQVSNEQLVTLLNGAIICADSRKDAPDTLASVRIWANNGKFYAAATDRYRLIEGKIEATGEMAPVMVKVKLLKNLIPILEDSRQASLSVNNSILEIDTLLNKSTLEVMADSFPPYEHLFNQGEAKPVSQIAFNPKFMADFGKIAGKNQPVNVEFYGDGKPIKINMGDNWRALLMPMKLR